MSKIKTSRLDISHSTFKFFYVLFKGLKFVDYILLVLCGLNDNILHLYALAMSLKSNKLMPYLQHRLKVVFDRIRTHNFQ